MRHTNQEMAGLRVVVTGAGGFIGGFVMDALAKAGATPIGLIRAAQTPPNDPRFQWTSADLVSDPLTPLLADLRPDTIIHCAGRTFAPPNDAGRADLFTANLTATERLIEAVSQLRYPVRVVIVSSAAIWAPMTPDQAAIDEQHPMRPIAAYGDSKAAATRHALAESNRLDIDLAVAVPFNVIGPGQPQRLVPQVFIDQLRADPTVFTLSNATTVRDWVDVRDVAEALVALSCPVGPRGLYNIASSEGRSLQDLFATLCAIGGWQPDLHYGTPHLTASVNRSIGTPQRLMAATGWSRQIRLDASLRDMIFGMAP